MSGRGTAEHKLREAYRDEVEQQLASWMQMASLIVCLLFLSTGTATLLFARDNRGLLLAARFSGAVVCFVGLVALRRPNGRRYLYAVVAATYCLATFALGAICWRAGGIDSMYVNSAPVAYMLALFAPTLRWIFLPVICAFLVAMIAAAHLVGVPAFTIALKTIYHVVFVAMFVFGGVLLDRFRLRAFKARWGLKQFLPAAVGDEIVAGNVAPAAGFERRKVTVLFADLVAFTDLADALEPEDMSSLLNEYLGEMSAAAVEHGGTVDKFVGDAVMVLFGAPKKLGEREQSMAAVKTALAMQVRVARLGEAWRDRGVARALELRIGINTGYCTVGVFGSDELRSYTAVGTPVNVASRLQAEAQPGAVLCSFATHGPIRDDVTARPLGELSLRGVSRSVEAFEVTAVG